MSKEKSTIIVRTPQGKSTHTSTHDPRIQGNNVVVGKERFPIKDVVVYKDKRGNVHMPQR